MIGSFLAGLSDKLLLVFAWSLVFSGVFGCSAASLFALQETREVLGTPQITPKSRGFEKATIEVEDLEIEFFLSTDGKPVDRQRKLPVVIFLQGSGATPIYFGKSPRIGSSVMFDSQDFPQHHYVIISKPGLPFYAEERSIDSETYDRFTSLEYRVELVQRVVDYLLEQPWVNQSQMVLIGHSEGADVAPWAAVACPEVTHVAVLAPGAVSQMLDFTIVERKKVLRGEQTEAEAAAEISSNLEAYRKIFKDPNNWQRKWYGHSYLRWSSFLRPAMEAYTKLDRPILAIAGRDDSGTPCESAEALELEFIRLGKDNLTFELWPVDHYFVETKEDESKVDRRIEVGKRINQWLKDAQAHQ